MRLFPLVILIDLVIGMSLVGCHENKTVDYFKKHSDQLLPNAIECTRLPSKDVLHNKTCLSIAELEKSSCEQELKLTGRVNTPRGWIYNCDDPYYLIARPIIDAKMRAYISGQPDPIVEYLKKQHEQ